MITQGANKNHNNNEDENNEKSRTNIHGVQEHNKKINEKTKKKPNY